MMNFNITSEVIHCDSVLYKNKSLSRHSKYNVDKEIQERKFVRLIIRAKSERKSGGKFFCVGEQEATAASLVI